MTRSPESSPLVSQAVTVGWNLLAAELRLYLAEQDAEVSRDALLAFLDGEPAPVRERVVIVAAETKLERRAAYGDR